MLKKLMSLAVISMLMVGCTETNNSFKQGIEDTISNTKQEQKVQTKKEQQVKTKKKQNDNIDPETGLAKVKDGTHLQEEAAKQDKQNEDDSIWTKDYCPECEQPIDDCICNGDTDDSIDNSSTTIYNHDNVVPDEFKNGEDAEPECPDCGQPLSKCDYNGGHTTVESLDDLTE